MASPFPGMDPYLESKEIWRSFHHHLAEEIMTVLNSMLSARYYADVEVRTTVEEVGVSASEIFPDVGVLAVAPVMPAQAMAVAIPDAPIQRTAVIPDRTRLRAVHVRLTDSGKLVTSIEILSPVNKRGDGLETYRQKRRRILLSDVHLIELDLLRGGQRPGWEVNSPPIDTDYVVLVNRAGQGDARLSKIWPIALNERLPVIPVPLLAPDADVALDLGTVLHNIYTRAAYARRIDYGRPVPPPKLRPAMQRWLETQEATTSEN